MKKLTRKTYCAACDMHVNNIRSRLNAPHTCGKTDTIRIAKGLKDIGKKNNFPKK